MNTRYVITTFSNQIHIRTNKKKCIFAIRELRIKNGIMKKHNGMRPQDIIILIKILSYKGEIWRNIDIANFLNMSASEVSEALNRCKIARLIDSSKRQVNINSFIEFLIYGLKYVFPAEPGSIVKGVATAHSAYPISDRISAGSDENYVWPYAKGVNKGQAIDPLYKTVPAVVGKDNLFYEILVIIDTLRIGRTRERDIAIHELKTRLKNG